MSPDNLPVTLRVEKAYKGRFVHPERNRDLEYFDALPQQVREAIADSPWGISSEDAYHFLRTHGLVQTLREVNATADAFFVAFEADTGVPRPVKPIGRGMGVKRWRR